MVIPAYNAERFIADAVQSVLDQTYPRVECVVIDDGSTDGTAAMVEGFGESVSYERQPNQGVSAARNRGAELAAGELLAFLDADDVWLPDRVRIMVALLDTRARTAALCATTVVDSDLNQIGSLRVDPTPSVESMLLQDGGLVSSSSNLLISRKRFEAVGGFDLDLSVSADWELLLRLVGGGGVVHTDEALVLYRRHQGNMSRDIAGMARDMTHAYESAFRRLVLPRAFRRRAYARLHWMLAGSYRDVGERASAVSHLLRATTSDPRFTARRAAGKLS